MVKERQENELINNANYGLLDQRRAVDARRRRATGAPTPDDLDELIAKVWKEPAFFLAHPRAIAAFGRECTRRGVPPPTVTLFGSPFLTWRGLPLIPSRQARRERRRNDEHPAAAHRREEARRRRPVSAGHPRRGQPEPVGALMGINQRGAASYLVSLYCSAAVLTDDALGVLENVEVDNYHEYK